MKFFNIIIILLLSTFLEAQVSPPGLGDTNSASWYAMGLRQDLNEDKTFESMTYIGVGLKSDEDNYNLISKPAIVVLNQEFYNELDKNWKVSYAISYRKQMDYSMDVVNMSENIATQQELRLYARMAYSTKIGKVKLTQTARQEVRKFMDQDWKNTDEPLQLRSRLKSQASISLDENDKHSLTAGAEVLFSTSKDNITKEWSDFKYKEARFTMFYTYRPQETPIAISVGYMNNLIEKNSTHSAHYASVDITWENPFHIF